MVLGEFRETISGHLETLRLMLFELSKSDFWFIVFLLLVTALVWLALRGVRTWYWKQNRILESLEDIQAIMERMLELQLRMAHKPSREPKLLNTLFDEQEMNTEREHDNHSQVPPGTVRKGTRQGTADKYGSASAGRTTPESGDAIPEVKKAPTDDRTERRRPLPPNE